ncbi:polysaccharide biosynthesis tyrosine autokinase [Sphingobacterium sp. lm-10]|uniref:GumC family protein n=1 Tax=Sphingobacterium sp. lm-10 TaxID=2944904 RepID=UPI002021E33A|nr:polysaccharide biosynthesis tyrosine autokinase [Sphingobacterium sp. lm-10]MCL7988644.1 polysaccharide biosynthesis tyrosine autokinase [Sphingobacterium sp. lm-10]
MSKNDWNEEFEFEEKPSDNKELLRLVGRVMSNWYWFALCALIGLTGSFLYLRYTLPIYTVDAKLLVSDDKKGGNSLAGSPMADLSGLMGTKSSVDNEVEVLSTNDLMRETVHADSSYISYYMEGTFNDRPVYNAPFRLILLSDPDSIRESFNFQVEYSGGKGIVLSGSDTTIEAELGKPFLLEGVGLVLLNQSNTRTASNHYGFTVKPVGTVVASLMRSLKVSVTNKNVSTIDLTLSSTQPKRGEEQLQQLIKKYMERNLHDKNVVADSTLSFINARLTAITQELAGVEDRISGYKQSTQLADMTEQSRILLENSASYTRSLAEIDVQLSSLDGMSSYLRDASNPRVVPASVVLQDVAFNALINRYNELVLQRERLLLANTEDNPLVKNITMQIAGVREDMISSLASTKRNLELSRSKQEQMSGQLTSQIQRVPTIERGYIDLARLQQIKQAQYIFLQEKWEETAIGRTANVSNSKVIDTPKSREEPISPKRKTAYAMGLILGLLVPLGFLYLKNLLNVRVMSMEDIERDNKLPILGTVAHSEDKDQVVITKTSRSAIAEQFRAIRTNLEFALHGKKTILFTSSMSGEGKSYVALNLAVSLALLDKKVLIMELDLRKPSITTKLNLPAGKGFSHYVVRPDMRLEEIVMSSGVHENVDLIQAGAIPPNPAELLVSGRAEQLMATVKEKYDYVLMDAPPVGMVTDAQLLNRYADLCLYLVRHGHTYKEQLRIPNDLVSKDKIKPIQLVVNDVKATGGFYSNYGYGYGYGYGEYGQEQSSKNWWQQLFKRK